MPTTKHSKNRDSTPTVLAYCGADGRIFFSDGPCPRGMLVIGRCTALAARKRNAWRRMVETAARRGYDDRSFFVPGIPEAADQIAGLDALHAFSEAIRERAGKVA